MANDDQKAYHHYIHQRFKDKRFVLLLHNIKRFVSLFVCFFKIKKKGEDAAPTAATSWKKSRSTQTGGRIGSTLRASPIGHFPRFLLISWQQQQLMPISIRCQVNFNKKEDKLHPPLLMCTITCNNYRQYLISFSIELQLILLLCQFFSIFLLFCESLW